MLQQFFVSCSFRHVLLQVVAVAVSIKVLSMITAETTSTTTTSNPDQNVDPGNPLYLTPMIKSGELSKAKEAALVKDFFPVISYSGFITVNSAHKSNIFFWFFPEEGTEVVNNAPVILWNDGGPGLSAFFSIFSQNAPFLGIAPGDNYTLNPHSWTKKYNMIYMDNPVEIGFSFTESEDGYVRSAPEAARDIYEFLTQFFSLFPDLQKNPFYNAGASYGSTYAIQTANLIHQQNSGTPKLFINLVGLILDSPWIDPYNQVEDGDFLFNLGLIGDSARTHFKEKEREIRSLIDREEYLDAYSMWEQITQSDSYNFTGYEAVIQVYKDQATFIDMTPFITKNSTRKAIHVGALKYSFLSMAQRMRMLANVMRSSKPEMETLLQAGYKFLVYVGNMDGTTTHLGVQKLIRSLSWKGASELINGPRVIWKEKGRVAGYNMTSDNGNMTLLIVRNSGHGCLMDQPEWVFSAVKSFIGEVHEDKNL